MSNGARFTSASDAIRKMTKPSGWAKTYHRCCWSTTISRRLIEPAIKIGPTNTNPGASS
jgi:hypothetical protein